MRSANADNRSHAMEQDAPRAKKVSIIPPDGIMPQYAHLKGMAENMPVIRKLLGLSEYGRISTATPIGRVLQRLIAPDSQDVVR